MDGTNATPPKEKPAEGGSLLRSPWFWATVTGLILIPLMRPLLRFEPDPPPVFFELPAYTLINQNGDPFGSDQLAGDVYVASFFFTSCRTICPVITAAMARLMRLYETEGIDGIRLVSFSVDPEHDTPEVLSNYAERHQIDGKRWTLVTGPVEEMRRLVIDGFKTPMGELGAISTSIDNQQPDHQAEGQHAEHSAKQQLLDIPHTGRLVIVDRLGGVRGYYEITEQGLDEIFHRSQHVLSDRRRR